MTVQGVVLNLMAARYCANSSGAQEPYEYTNIQNFERLVVHVRMLYSSDAITGSEIAFSSGNYKRSDCMTPLYSYTPPAEQIGNVYDFVLGRDGETATELGAWLKLTWVAGVSDVWVAEVKAVGR